MHVCLDRAQKNIVDDGFFFPYTVLVVYLRFILRPTNYIERDTECVCVQLLFSVYKYVSGIEGIFCCQRISAHHLRRFAGPAAFAFNLGVLRRLLRGPLRPTCTKLGQIFSV